MPQPEGAQLNQSISPMLTNIAIGLVPALSQYVAKDVFPTVPVAAPSGQFNVWGNGDFLRRGGKELSNYEAPPIEGFSSSKGTYATGHWGVSTVYTAQDLANAAIGGTSPAQLKINKTTFVTHKGLLEREITTAAKVQTSGNWSTTRAGASSGGFTSSNFTKWDVSGSTPVDDVNQARELMRLLTGFTPNVMVLPVQVLNKLYNNADLIDRIKYAGTPGNPTEVTLAQIAQLFKIDKIVVPEGVYNTAAKGAADSLSYIWSTTVWMGYVTPTPGILTPSAGYNFAWNGNTDVGLPAGIPATDGPNPWGSVLSPEGLFIRTYQQERPQGRFIDCEKFDQPNVTAAGLGMTFTAPIG